MSAPLLAVYQNGKNQVSGDAFNTFTQWCVNVAQLRGLVGLSNIMVYIEGFTTAGDGGQGPFYWNSGGTSPDDNGITTVIPNGAANGCWSRLGAAGLVLSNLTVTGNAIVDGSITASQIAFSSTSGIIGVTTNNNAAAGSVGEYISSTVLSGSAVPLTTNTVANVTSITLLAGDWDVWGNAFLLPASGTTTNTFNTALSQVAVTFPTTPNGGAYAQWYGSITGSGVQLGLPTGTMRVSIAAPVNIYLVVSSQFTSSTSSAYGFVGARRVR